MLGGPWWYALAGASVMTLVLASKTSGSDLTVKNGAATHHAARTLSSLAIGIMIAPLAFLLGRLAALLVGL